VGNHSVTCGSHNELRAEKTGKLEGDGRCGRVVTKRKATCRHGNQKKLGNREIRTWRSR
jgi:hypothetical protein